MKRRLAAPLLIGVMTVLLTASTAAAKPADWVHVCVFPDPEAGILVTSYGHVSGPGMNTPEAEYWTDWCEDMNGQVRGVRPFPKHL